MKRGRRVGVSVALLAAVTTGGAIFAAAVSGVTVRPGLTKVATVKPANFGLYDLTWYGSVFGKPTVYLSDQSGIVAINAKTDTYLGSIGQHLFVPLGGGAAACGLIGGIGPDGILSLAVGPSNQVWVGDGNSTVKVFTLSEPGVGQLAAAINTGGQCRADEFSYDPVQHLVLIANPSETSNFVSFITVHANPKMDTVVGKIAYPNATGGLEQSVYNPNDGDFYLNVVQSGSVNSNVGAVDVISPATKRVVRSFPVVGCQPAGMALDQQADELLLGCGAKNALMIMDAKTGAIVHTITGVGGADEVTYDPVSQDFLAPSTTPGGTAVLAEISAKTGQLVATATLPANAFTHSIAAGGGRAYVPVAGDGMVVYAVR